MFLNIIGCKYIKDNLAINFYNKSESYAEVVPMSLTLFTIGSWDKNNFR